ncbi:MAG: molybdopterin-guanine dinucleotide biosynthesis protein A [Pseudomonadota bacterium]
MRVAKHLLLILLASLALGGLSGVAQDQTSEQPFEDQEASDRHELYYYPEVTSRETYVARAPSLPDSDRQRRLGFVIGFTQQQYERPYFPPVAIFAKGTDAEKMLIVATTDGAIGSLYQARAYLAQLTSIARVSPVFVDNRVEDFYTFLDLLVLMGFEQLTISDGQTYTHQIIFEPRQN